jgi:hypothetical protein
MSFSRPIELYHIGCFKWKLFSKDTLLFIAYAEWKIQHGKYQPSSSKLTKQFLVPTPSALLGFVNAYNKRSKTHTWAQLNRGKARP